MSKPKKSFKKQVRASEPPPRAKNEINADYARLCQELGEKVIHALMTLNLHSAKVQQLDAEMARAIQLEAPNEQARSSAGKTE